MPDLSGPRKPRNTVENIEDDKQRAIVSIIDPYIKRSGYTKKNLCRSISKGVPFYFE